MVGEGYAPEVVTIGETMLCLTPERAGRLRYADRFIRGLAGAESNVAIGLARLSHRARFISRLGNDEFGHYIGMQLRAEGVDTAGVRTDGPHPTGLMVKELRAGAETAVVYYRAGSAASHMTPAMLTDSDFSGARILHITGITPALSDGCRETVLHAVAFARRHGLLVSFDPNIRLRLWNIETARPVLCALAQTADILLPGLSECNLLWGENTAQGHAQALLAGGASIVAVKLGAEGALIAWRAQGTRPGGMCHVPAYPVSQIADPVGAGDAFAAGFLAGLLEGTTPARAARMGACMGACAMMAADDYQSLPDRAELARLLDGAQEIYR